jgi:hypothetical protein
LRLWSAAKSEGAIGDWLWQGPQSVRFTATAAYALDRESADFFGAPEFKLIHLGESVTGRFGSDGSIEGTLSGRLLIATWRDGMRRGWLTLAFSKSFRSFLGDYGQYEERHSVRGRKRVSRLPRLPSASALVTPENPVSVHNMRGRRLSQQDALKRHRTSDWRD